MDAGNEGQAAVAQKPGTDSTPPTATVVGGNRYTRPLSRAEVKRARYLTNLRAQHNAFKESLAHAQHFFTVTELPAENRAEIQAAHDRAISAIESIIAAKLAEYDKRAGTAAPGASA